MTLDRLIDSWVIDLRGRHLSPRTVETYERSARGLAKWLDGAELTTDAVRRYMAYLAGYRTPGGVSVDYRALRQLTKWLAGEGFTDSDVMARLRPPVVPDPETRVLREEEIARLLKACEGKRFAERRDMAIISLLLDTGIRREELAGLCTDHVSVSDREAYVMGKGRRARIAPFGHRTAKAIDRYLLLRESHKRADLPALWLAERGGALTGWGIAQAIERRGAQAGIPDLHLHVFRHSWAHHAKSVMHDDEMMRLAGWKSRQMLGRYAASTADERARETGKKYALLDRI